jgi:hypothetical protein
MKLIEKNTIHTRDSYDVKRMLSTHAMLINSSYSRIDSNGAHVNNEIYLLSLSNRSSSSRPSDSYLNQGKYNAKNG